MTTNTAPLPKSTRLPVITALSGLLVFVVGLLVGRIHLQPSANASSLSAHDWATECGQLHAIYGGSVGNTPLCHQAYLLNDLSGLLILIGLAAAGASITMALHRVWKRRTVHHLPEFRGYTN
jgi:hypothetical protein